MSIALVLGGTGFIGHHLCRELLGNGYKVKVLARQGGNRSLLKGMDIEFIEGTLENTEDLRKALAGCDYLLHVAGHYPIYSLNPTLEEKTGLDQVASIHFALTSSEVKRFLYVSTLTALGKYTFNKPEDEHAPYPVKRNKSAYFRVKRAMQQAVLEHSGKFNSVIVAPTAVYGEGDCKPTTGRIIVEIANKRLPAVINGKTNAVDVRDVARGIVQALEKGKQGRVYVLGGENMTIREFVNRCSTICEVERPKISFPPGLFMPFAWSTEIIGKLLSHEKPLFPMVGLHFAKYGEFISSELAIKEIGYSPGNIDDAIKRAYDWFVANNYIHRK